MQIHFPTLRLIAILLLILLLGQLLGRFWFPYDIFFASESTQLTNIWKHSQAIPIYTAPAEANSHIYVPGIELIGYFMGLGLDIRLYRVLVITLGFFSALWATSTLSGNYTQKLFPFIITTLILFRSFTADVLHPDNLQFFLTLGAYSLSLYALKTNRFGIALIAIIMSSLVLIAKQTGAFCLVGTAIILIGYGQWSWKQKGGMIVVGLSIISLLIFWIDGMEYGRYYTLFLPQQQPLDWQKIALIPKFFLKVPNLALLALLTPFSLWHLWKTDKRTLSIWASFGIFAIAPTMGAFLKAFGTWNNFTLTAIYCFLPIWYWLSSRPKSMIHKTILALLLITLIPVKMIVTPAMHEHFNAVQATVSADIDAGKTIWFPHGTVILLEANAPIPLDRTISLWELDAGEQDHLAETAERLATGYYDRLYLSNQWYPKTVMQNIDQYYEVVEVIEYTGIRPRFINGFQENILQEMKIYEQKKE